MGFFGGLLMLPALGPLRMVHWLGRTLAEEAEREMLDEGPIRGALLDLQARFDAGDLTEEEYDRRESGLLERLKAVREMKAEHSGRQ
ncbi:MAG: gas vesicle protein GvpG [Chloroflexi bacterium]|nr:gas vesicle protein GvpG [Chloroflexota bacterium]